jgi:hypothetical protein
MVIELNSRQQWLTFYGNRLALGET